MHDILKYAMRQCEAAEVYSLRSLSTSVLFEGNRLKGVDRSERSGIALRVIKNGRLGFCSSTKQGDVERLVAAAVATTDYGAPATYAFPGSAMLTKVDNYDPTVADISVDSLIEIGQRYVDVLRSVHPKLAAYVSQETNIRQVAVVNSSGLDATHKSTSYKIFMGEEVATGDDQLLAFEASESSNMNIDAQAASGRMADYIRNGVRAASLPSGTYPVLLAPIAFANLISRVTACADGQAVDRGVSPWKDKIDTQVMDARISLYDDQTRPGSPMSSPFDDEGTPRSRLPIIEHGVLRNFTLDRRTASSLGRAPTGNGIRSSLGTPPAIDTASLVIDPGQVWLADMTKSIKRGVVVNWLRGAWTGNPYGGELSGNIALGFVVENGEVVGRINDAMLSLNVFETLSERLLALSSEQIDSGNSVYPYMLVDGVSVVTKG